MKLREDIVRQVVDSKMGTFPKEVLDRAVSFIVEYLDVYHARSLEQQFDEITGGGVNLILLSQKICHISDIVLRKELGIKYFKWLSGDCPAAGHNLMNGIICCVDEDSAMYERGTDDEMVKKDRLSGMPKGSPADCDEFCRCSTVMFDPDID